jgi:hypothetical protein
MREEKQDRNLGQNTERATVDHCIGIAVRGSYSFGVKEEIAKSTLSNKAITVREVV